MFKFLLRNSNKETLVDKTPLSRFIHEASSAEKKRVYARVISEAARDQNRVLEAAAKSRLTQPNNQDVGSACAM